MRKYSMSHVEGHYATFASTLYSVRQQKEIKICNVGFRRLSETSQSHARLKVMQSCCIG